MSNRAGSIVAMYPLFQGGEGGPTPTPALSAKELRVERIPFEAARELNARWHSRLPRIGTGAVNNQRLPSFAAMHADTAYAVAIWSKPVARELPQRDWLELRRLATSPESPRNTCSRMLRVMELLLRRARPDVVNLISYQDTASHTGGIYRAAGWTQTAVRRGEEWSCPSRPRPNVQAGGTKHRWEKALPLNHVVERMTS